MLSVVACSKTLEGGNSFPFSVCGSVSLRKALLYIDRHPQDISPKKAVWNYYIKTRDYERLIESAGDYCRDCEERSDLNGMIYALAYVVQSYTFWDRYDSAFVKIEALERLYDSSG